MKVRMFCDSANHGSGIARYVQEIARRLTRTVEDCELELVCRWERNVAMFNKVGVPYSVSRLTWERQMVLQDAGLGDDLMFGLCDIVHEPNFARVRITGGAKLVVTVHDVGWRLDDTPYGLTPEWIYDAEKAIQQADYLITPTQTVKEDVLRIFPRNPDQIVVIPHGVDERFLDSRNGSPVNALPSRYWLFVGAVSARKNLRRVIEALACQPRRHPLVVAGPKTDYLEYLVRESNIRNVDLITLHDLTDEHLVTVYRRALGLVYPSLWEGFGLPIVEAAASGIPVITANNGAPREIAKGYAFLVDPRNIDQIQAAMTRVESLTKADRTRIHDQGRQWARSFSWDTSASLHRTLYRQIGSRLQHL